MREKKIVKKSVLILVSILVFGCVGDNMVLPKENSLSQERLFLVKNSFVKNRVEPTVSFPKESDVEGKAILSAGLINAVIGTIAPSLIENSLDFMGKSIVKLSGENEKTTTVESEISNFMFKDENYNTSHQEKPQFNLVFTSANFGKSEHKWEPKGLARLEKDGFQKLNIVGKPNFYMEAKIFPLPGNKYMEIVPTYMFYNKQFNSKGFDERRDLSVSFSFYDLESVSSKNSISEGSIAFKDVQVGREYTAKELAGVRTRFLKMPTISKEKKGYSGGYNLVMRVTETRDINEWLASLGETIIGSKNKISQKLYVTDERKIELEKSYEKAKNEVAIMEAMIDEAKEKKMSKSEILKLKGRLFEKKSDANLEAIKAGKSKIY